MRLVRDRRFVRLARLFVLIASVCYLVAVIVVGMRHLEGLPWRAFLSATGVGLALYPISLVAQAVAWSLGMRSIHGRGPVLKWTDIEVYARSHLLKRLPGGFWYVGERVAAYRIDGLDPSVPVLASIVEWLLLLGTAAILFVGSEVGPDREAIGKLGGAFLGCGAIGWLVGLAIAVRWNGRSSATKSSPERRRISLTYLAVAELYALAFVVGGKILLGFIEALGDSSFTWSEATHVWALVAGIGTVVSLLPAGLGVRDATLAVVLAPYVSQPAPVVIAILLRLLFVAGDLVWGLVLIFVVRLLRPNPRIDT